MTSEHHRLVETDDRYYTVDEIAELLGVCSRTIYNAIRAGRLKAKRLGRLWRLKRAWVEQFLGE